MPAGIHSPLLSLYVHIPWCVRKCPYCDFNSHEAGNTIDENRYIDALMFDLEKEADLAHDREIQSIFFGGGTPSLFSPDAFSRILREVNQYVRISSDAEITMEANPGTFEQHNFAAYRSAGINRLSIGIQSFNGESLRQIGRIHDGTEAISAISTAQKAGFDNINLDLMFGLPKQSLAEAENDVRMACESGVQHISHYQLTIEPGTAFGDRFASGGLRGLPGEDLSADMYDLTQSVTEPSAA